jgi:predicted HAD superfamily Cof-like phosphohydrolase
MTTDFEKVCEFNKCFDFPVHDDMSDPKCLQLRLDLIKEEIDELIEAFNEDDIIEEQDACADILYVAYGMAHTYKWNSDKYFKEKYFLKNETEINLTLFKNLHYPNNVTKDKLIDMLFDIYNELVISTSLKDTEMTQDVLHKLMYHIYLFQDCAGYDSDRIFKIVHESNMSKLCKTEEEAQLTVDKYLIDYKNGVTNYDSPYYYKLDNGLYVIKNKSTGKALKSINYIKVKL